MTTNRRFTWDCFLAQKLVAWRITWSHQFVKIIQVFHVGTNEIPSEKTPQVIARSIVDLAKSVTNDNLQVQFLVLLHEITSGVRRLMRWTKFCWIYVKMIPFISHSAIDTKKNLNHSKFHLNIRGSRKLQEIFARYLKGFSSWVNVTRNESESFDSLSTKSKESFSTVNGESFFKESQLSTLNEDICFG